MTPRVAGVTSTGSKRPDALFGLEADSPALPRRMQRSGGARVWDDQGREFLDFIMALGAVGLGYGHPDVNQAVIDAVERGSVGSLPPVEEEALAGELAELIPSLERVRFLKSGAEAVAAAVRLARAATQRDRVLGCGYHGWLDWCSREPGVPTMVRTLYDELPFNDTEQSVGKIRDAGDALACVVIEPVVDAAPEPEWLRTIRAECTRSGAMLIFDEIKTAFRVGPGGAAARWGGEPDLLVLGKALANGFPIAAVGGRADLMEQVNHTWISSTMATEFVSLAAARATIRVWTRERAWEGLADRGARLFAGLEALARRFPGRLGGVAGIPEMCHLRFPDPADGMHLAQGAALRGVLFKRTAYNFVSLAHQDTDIDTCLGVLGKVCEDLPS